MLLRALALVSALFMSGTALAQTGTVPPAPPAATPAAPQVQPLPAPAPVPTAPAAGMDTTAGTGGTKSTPTAVSQGDPRWKNLQLARGVTVGKAGCLLVSLFTSVLEMGYNFDLISFLRTLTDNDLFDRFGRLRWDIQKAIPGLSAERLSLAGAAALAAAKERIADGSRIVLQVVTSRGTRHWIAVMKIVGDTFIVSDPDGGKVGTLSSLYGTNAVRGLAVLTQN
jgi:hypothetical protein